MKTALITAAAAALATLSVSPAHAQGVKVAVSYGDLDITSAAGAEALAGRIETNVGAACGRGVDLRNLKAVSLCKEAMISDAVTKLNGRGATQAAAALATKG